MPPSHYLRAIGVACAGIALSFPPSVLDAVFDIKEQLKYGNLWKTYPGWKEAHSQIDEIQLFDATWRLNVLFLAVRYYAWVKNFLFSVIFFAFFGTSTEIRAAYRNILYRCAKRFGLNILNRAPAFSSDVACLVHYRLG